MLGNCMPLQISMVSTLSPATDIALSSMQEKSKERPTCLLPLGLSDATA